MKRLIQGFVALALVACTGLLAGGPAQAVWVGNATSIADAPWVVAVRTGANETCGGTLISPAWVLTAAHCVQNEHLVALSVVAGADDPDSVDLSMGVRVLQVVLPPAQACTANSCDPDIALLLLASSVTLDEYPALPTDAPRPGAQVSMFGWGTPEGFGHELRVIQGRVLGVPLPGAILTNGAPGQTCAGDSGGPVITEVDGQVTMVGVISAAFRLRGLLACGIGRQVSTSVASHAAWIEDSLDHCYALTPGDTSPGTGLAPYAATPGNSAGCPSGTYRAGSEVTLNAGAVPTWEFAAWVSDPDVSDAFSEVTSANAVLHMPAKDIEVGAAYVAPGALCLSLNRTVLGAGSIALDPTNGDACSADHHYVAGTHVQVTAVPDPGYHFVGWKTSGVSELADATSQTTVVAVPQHDFRLTAYFEPNP